MPCRLDVKLRGVAHISYHLMRRYTDWRVLEETIRLTYSKSTASTGRPGPTRTSG